MSAAANAPTFTPSTVAQRLPLAARACSVHYDEWPHHVVVCVLDDVAMVGVRLGCRHSNGQIELCSNPREVTRVRLDGILESTLFGRGWFHRASGKGCGIEAAGHAVSGAVRGLVDLDVERCSTNDLERNQ